ncbi:hypothetical protein TSAR_008693 [Trichomalopsis sarcophagae]|uniref:Uncharacterized protein n=1 Tax=Trichomalopsis sarcophagae TaxID=543379 RepID=A0A232F7P2_9HYME|nr:hypothetical protein TSAR_008693 [Trichomalopsis sarcophagae]
MHENKGRVSNATSKFASAGNFALLVVNGAEASLQQRSSSEFKLQHVQNSIFVKFKIQLKAEQNQDVYFRLENQE